MRVPSLTILTLLAMTASGCVTTGTFEKKINEAKALELELASLRQEQDQLLLTKGVLETERGQLSVELTGLRDQLRTCEAERNNAEKLIRNNEGALSFISGLRQQLDELSGANTSLRQEIDALLKIRREEVRKSSSCYEELQSLLKDEISRGEAAVSELKGVVTVTIFEPALFDPGSPALKPSAGSVLQKLAKYLKQLQPKSIHVEGFTETVLSATWPVQTFPTGWEFSAARAVAVTRYIQNEGISPFVLSSAAFGEYRPLSDNISEMGRARNRRIQLVIVSP